MDRKVDRSRKRRGFQRGCVSVMGGIEGLEVSAGQSGRGGPGCFTSISSFSFPIFFLLTFFSLTKEQLCSDRRFP